MIIDQLKKLIRNTKGKAVEDVGSIANVLYNEASGGQKNLPVGPALKPLDVDGSGTNWTTDATTARALVPGSILAIYNTSGAAESVTFGEDNTVSALAAGVTNASGHVGIPCPPHSWSYLSSYDKRFVRSTSANLKVFIIRDESFIIDQSIKK